MQLELNPGGRPVKDATPGAPMFPSPTAGNGKPLGRTDQEVFYSCKQCGHWNLASRVQSPGSGNDGDGGITVSVSAGVGDPAVASGACAFCGSYNSRST